MDTKLRHSLRLKSFPLSNEQEQILFNLSNLPIYKLFFSQLRVEPKPTEPKGIAGEFMIKLLEIYNEDLNDISNDFAFKIGLSLPVYDYFLEELKRKEKELEELKDAINEFSHFPRNVLELVEWYLRKNQQIKFLDAWPELKREDLKEFSNFIERELTQESVESPFEHELDDRQIKDLYNKLIELKAIPEKTESDFKAILRGEEFSKKIVWKESKKFLRDFIDIAQKEKNDIKPKVLAASCFVDKHGNDFYLSKPSGYSKYVNELEEVTGIELTKRKNNKR